jgi:hypothetical protein
MARTATALGTALAKAELFLSEAAAAVAAALVVAAPLGSQVVFWRVRASWMSLAPQVGMHEVTELTKSEPQMHLVSQAFAHLAEVRALA